MKFIVLAITLIGALANAEESEPASFSLVPAVQKTAVVDGKKYYITRDEKNKFVFIKHDGNSRGFAVKPIIVIPTIPENNQK